MPAINPDTSITISLPAGQVLTLTANAAARGTAVRMAVSAGEADQSVTPVAGADLTFGPYAQTERFRIGCTAGSLSYAVGSPDPSLGATDAEVATSYATKAGTTTNDSAAAGSVGQFVTSTVASGSAVALTTATAANVTSISLTAGDWDVSAAVQFALTGVTGTQLKAGLSLTTATLPTQAGGSGLGTDPLAILPLISTVLSDTASVAIAPVRISLAATTTVYLVAQQAFSVGTSAAYGTIRARRVR